MPVSLWLRLFCLELLLVLPGGCQSAAPRPTAAGERPAVTLALLGDINLGRGVHPSSQSFDTIAADLKSADLALANLESPLTSAPVRTDSPYALCAPPVNVRYLSAAGFDLFALANNHRLDCGEAGLAETESTLAAAGLGFIGPDARVVYRVVNGIKLAFLAFDATGQLAAFDAGAAQAAVRAARQTGAVVVVSMHWGLEYQAGATADQQRLAAQLSQAGAALIWGQHPHVLQPAAWLNQGKTLVLYSLGNALFDQAGLESTRRSALVLVRLGAGGVEEMHAIPFVIDVVRSRIVQADPASEAAIMQYFRATQVSK